MLSFGGFVALLLWIPTYVSMIWVSLFIYKKVKNRYPWLDEERSN